MEKNFEFNILLTIDNSIEINHYRNKVSLSPADCNFDYLKSFHLKKLSFNVIF